ncbi:cyclic nucleotide-binding domain protein (macronuclear) [Tetrahymena thermophila SB210]|uniref:Cyclic nucleotide-binding domain protein n=1 Tax=Tetrahymena thermophila (strain SB210) TaxID=312017 RepID=I7M7Z2_TETTS|nr:cyclic nucleotide-binding domain protein [Tetrahymena thermophila SB210]EAR96305.2 cyclic nucleotide-binding domain protein [Tetrahymena thermophila SB210]|eukprot:XP_001016550.2 cyclic nucleotide-binding domain protein [Tetrahymena thermophila SB210]
MNFNTSFFKQGVINNNRIDIIKRYGKSKFWFDIIIVLPYIFGQNSQFYQSIFILRAFLIRNIIHRLEEVFHPRNLGAALVDIIKVIFVISFIAHLFCCSFYYLSTFETGQTTWVTKLNLEPNDIFGLYVAGVYYSVITMITLGYGDIVPTTTVERIFVVGMTLVSCAVFAYSVNTISGIIGDFSSRKKYFRQKMMNLNLHIQKRGLNKQLAMTVRKYIEYLYKEEMVSNESAEKDLEQIPLSLKEDVYQDIYGKLLRQNKVFNLNFSLEFLDKLALKMKEKRFGPEEIIYREGDEGNTLYFLIKGNVQLFLPIKGHKDNSYLQIQQLEKGTTFGFYSFFSGNNRETSARSMRVTSLVTLNLEDFREAAEKFPKDYEKFCMLRDQIKYSNLTKGLDVRCTSCDNYTHQLQQCPFLKYKPEKTILIAKYNKSDPMQRKEQQRRIIRSPNSLFLLQFITKDDIYCFLNLDGSDSDNDHYHQEQEEAVDLEEQFNDKRTSYANVDDREDYNKIRDNTSQNYKDNYIKENSSIKEFNSNNNIKDQAYIESQQNKRQSTYHRIESSLSYKRKIMSQHTTASNMAKQASKLTSRLSFRSQKIQIEKTQNQVIMDFILIDIDKLKSYQNYLPQNNFEKVIQQYNESLIMQKVYKPKKQLYQIVNKDRQKINLSKLRVIAAFKKVNKNQQIITTKHKIESQSRKKAILEQLKQHSEGNSDYLTYESNPNKVNQNNNDIREQKQSPESGKYEIKVLSHSKNSINSEKQPQNDQENKNEGEIKQNNLLINQSCKSESALDQDILSKSEDVDKIKYKILKKKKTSSFVVKPSQFYQENQAEEQEFSKDQIEQKRQKSHKQIHEAIMNYNMKRRSFSNIINNSSFTDIQQNDKDNN